VVSWGRAFRGALATVAWVIVWYIIGGLIILFGILGSIRMGYYGPELASWWWWTLIPAVIIGGFIIGLGYMAAVYKIQSEIMAEEVERRLGPKVPVSRRAKFCPSCGTENPEIRKFCIKCGTALS